MPLAEQHTANRPIVEIFPEGDRLPVWLNFDCLVGLDPRTLRSDIMLRLAPWFHLIEVRDGALIQSYTENSENLPGDLHGVINRS